MSTKVWKGCEGVRTRYNSIELDNWTYLMFIAS